MDLCTGIYRQRVDRNQRVTRKPILVMPKKVRKLPHC